MGLFWVCGEYRENDATVFLLLTFIIVIKYSVILYVHRVKAFSSYLLVSKLEVLKEFVGDTAGTPDPKWPKECSMWWSIWHHTHKARSAWVGWSPAFLGWLSPCLPLGRCEVIPVFALLVCTAFSLPIKLFSYQVFFSLSCWGRMGQQSWDWVTTHH